MGMPRTIRVEKLLPFGTGGLDQRMNAGVLTWQGCTALTRIPEPAHSTAISRVIWLTPAFAALKLKLPRPSDELRRSS